MSEEIWKDVAGYDGYYQVSNLGRVRRSSGRVLKQGLNKRFGYLSACLCVNGIKVSKRVNILVAVAFIPNPLSKPQVNHIDHVKVNNRADNLDWMTASENKIHTVKAGRVKKTHSDGIVDAGKALKIREMWSSGVKQPQIASLFNLDQSIVSRVVNRKRRYRYL